MKLLLVAALMVSSVSFAQTEMMKSKLVEVKKKSCPMVNGKEDCTVKEVKTKVMDLKKKIGQ